MIDFVNYDITGAVAVVPVILAIIQALKMVGLPNKFAPIASIALGVIIGFLFRHDTADLSQTILAGVTYGLSASGLYSGVKSSSEAIKKDPKNNNERGF
jgi:Bacteriophage A118-like holin, Hol118